VTLWDQLGGRTWSQRAGPRSASATPVRHRRSRHHYLERSWLKARRTPHTKLRKGE
jgi:hypothetical protein